jgi:hypothetical protein
MKTKIKVMGGSKEKTLRQFLIVNFILKMKIAEFLAIIFQQ